MVYYYLLESSLQKEHCFKLKFCAMSNSVLCPKGIHCINFRIFFRLFIVFQTSSSLLCGSVLLHSSILSRVACVEMVRLPELHNWNVIQTTTHFLLSFMLHNKPNFWIVSLMYVHTYTHNTRIHTHTHFFFNNILSLQRNLEILHKTTAMDIGKKSELFTQRKTLEN